MARVCTKGCESNIGNCGNPYPNSSKPKITRALIVKKEWLDKIFDEGKVWEMRTTRTNINERIGLIESGTGLIMGEVDVMGCYEKPIAPIKRYIPYHKVEDLELIKTWKWAWFLKDAKRYKEPTPYKHPKGAVIWVKINKQP
jgi:hypothetical protein